MNVVSYQPTSFGELETFCKRVCGSGMVGPAYRGKPDDAAVAIMFGSELGLPPMTSLQFIAVINGKPGLHSDAMPGLAMSKGMIIDMQEHFEGEFPHDDFTAVCQLTRATGSVVEQRFSVGDAKRAGLWDKAGPWKQYPKRMLQWRARSWGVRDAAPHLMFGPSAEELADIETSRGPDKARDITPPEKALGPRAAVAAAMEAAAEVHDVEVVGQNGNDRGPTDFVEDERPSDYEYDPLHLLDLKAKAFLATLHMGVEQADALLADRYWQIYRDRAKLADEKVNAGDYASLEAMVTAKIEGR